MDTSSTHTAPAASAVEQPLSGGEVKAMIQMLGLPAASETNGTALLPTPTTTQPSSADAASTSKRRAKAKTSKRAKATAKPSEQPQPSAPSLPERFASRGVPTNQFLLKPLPKWYEIPVPELDDARAQPLADDRTTQLLYQQAEKLYLAEAEVFQRKPTIGPSDQKFIRTMLDSGTANDKVSALTLLIRESPLHAFKSFEHLFSLAGKSNRREAVSAVASLKDLFISSVLPQRKLRYFRDQPLGHPDAQPIHLVYWYYEDQLKKKHFQFIQILESLTFDTVPRMKRLSLTYTYDLLNGTPEGEENLLRLLVYKLGDVHNAVQASASNHLLNLVTNHPNMKLVVASVMEDFVLTTQTHDRACYYAMNTLNQFHFRSEVDTDLANKLIRIYFLVFHKIMDMSDPTQMTPQPTNAFKPSKQGKPGADPLDRVEAEANGAGEQGKKKKKMRWRDMKDGGQSKRLARDTKKQAYESRQLLLSRTEREKLAIEKMDEQHAKLVSAILTGINRALPYSAIDDNVFEGYVELLMRLTKTPNFNTVVQTLGLLHQLTSAKPHMSDQYFNALYASLLHPSLGTASKHAMYLNILYRSLTMDVSMQRVMAFFKRALQVAAYHQPPFICGLFYILAQLLRNRPSLVTLLREPEDHGEEEFNDAQSSAGDASDIDDKPAGSLTLTKPKPNQCYDPYKRNPLFARADTSCLWEIVSFVNHYHPTVRLYASLLVREEFPLNAFPNLHSYSLANFFDKFTSRNPKKPKEPTATAEHRSAFLEPQIDPLQPRRSGNVSMLTHLNAHTDTVVTEPNYKLYGPTGFPVDEHYLHAYMDLTQAERERKAEAKQKKALANKARKADEDVASGSDAESGGSMSAAGSDKDDGNEAIDEFAEDLDPSEENAVWDAMAEEMPELKGMLGGDGDDADDDFDDAMLQALQDDGGFDGIALDDIEVDSGEDGGEGESDEEVDDEDNDDDIAGLTFSGEGSSDSDSQDEASDDEGVVADKALKPKKRKSPQADEAGPDDLAKSEADKAWTQFRARRKKAKTLPAVMSAEEFAKLSADFE
ncbi:RNA-binding ribosome biosynthesis protein mak21 [Dimargaris xerosporica]|nr:RNA-binding ribosome biosynthesis protein mak21 [Dimargaris xerosporica]